MPNDKLTGREWDTLEALKLGGSNQDIATRLGLTVGTVKLHLVQVYEKLGVKNRTEAMVLKIKRPKGV